MKRMIALLFFAALSICAADVRWYYQIVRLPVEFVPAVPGSDGVMVFVRTPADHPEVCVAYNSADGVSRRACAVGELADERYPYTPVRINLGLRAEDFKVVSITVKLGDSTKTIVAPVPGVEY